MSVEKLNPLTSLRFFAASLIVVHHTQGFFGIGTDINRYLPTYQAVSFFFVLSGFILTYVYKCFDSREEIKKFYIARIARIWPLHVVTLMLAFFLFNHHDLPGAIDNQRNFQFYFKFLANFFMFQAWIPVKEYFWSFNAVSWSISAELAFYLLFPLLLFNLKQNWKIKLTVTFLISIFFVAISTLLRLPEGKGPEIGLLGLLNIHPTVRLFEFTAGMCTALFYDRLKREYNPALTHATVLECMIVFAVLGVMALNRPVQSIVEPLAGKALTAWIDNGILNVFGFAAMILFFALEKGHLSRMLSGKMFVMLGEISFSVYLLHQILIRFYKSWIAPVDKFPGFFSYIYFWAILITGSYLMWYAVEKPFRKAIIGIGTFVSTNREKQKPGDRFSYVKLLFIVVIISTLMFPVIFFAKTTPAIQRISMSEAETFFSQSDEPYRHVPFGDKLILLGANFELTEKENLLYLVWKAEKDMVLSMKVAVHFIDARREILDVADYYQSKRNKFLDTVGQGIIWLDTIHIIKDVYEKSHAIGICIYNNGYFLDIGKGPRDWNGKRLLIKIQKSS